MNLNTYNEAIENNYTAEQMEQLLDVAKEAGFPRTWEGLEEFNNKYFALDADELLNFGWDDQVEMRESDLASLSDADYNALMFKYCHIDDEYAVSRGLKRDTISKVAVGIANDELTVDDALDVAKDEYNNFIEETYGSDNE